MSTLPISDERLALIRKWFRAEAHGCTFNGAKTISAWYLTFETAEQVGKAHIALGDWETFTVNTVYSLDEPS